MAFPGQSEKKKLSKSILEMKFMKKSKEKAFRDEEDEEGKAMFASEVTQAMKIGGRKFVIEPSYVPCEDLIMGRLSYNGMNKEIEKLLELEKLDKDKKNSLRSDDGVDVSEKEMADRYDSLIGTISNKFKTKHDRDGASPARKKMKFMKPKDD